MFRLIFFLICCGSVRLQTEFLPTNYEEVSREGLGEYGAAERCGEGPKLGRSQCVPYYRCDSETNTITPEKTEVEEEVPIDYSLLIDIRLGETNPCTETLHVCCQIGSNTTSPTPVPTPSPTPPPKPTPTPGGDEQTPPPSTLSYCGIRNNNGIDFKITGNTHNEAEYGEFPWMVAILNSNHDPAVDPVLAVCGGSLITPKVILTGAHCVHKSQPQDIRVRAGEWDTQTTNERYPYQERNVEKIIVHEDFKDGVLLNDVAVLVLDKAFKKARHISTICLPDQNEAIDSKECYATGWGKNLFGKEGEYQVILKKIDLPIVPHGACENSLKQTRLGNHFKLHSSFICAGGVEGKDTCTGDGGSPLICPDPKNPTRYVQAGIVAWGIGCGTTTPGVYANVAKFRNWIDEKIQRLTLSTTPYVI